MFLDPPISESSLLQQKKMNYPVPSPTSFTKQKDNKTKTGNDEVRGTELWQINLTHIKKAIIETRSLHVPEKKPKLL